MSIHSGMQNLVGRVRVLATTSAQQLGKAVERN